MTRVLRAFTALVTVWCLGCATCEPLLVGGVGESDKSEMACAPDEGSGGSALNDVPSSASGMAITATSADAPPDCFCQCHGCYAPSPMARSGLTEGALPPGVPDDRPSELPSVVREPLVPPPQAAR